MLGDPLLNRMMAWELTIGNLLIGIAFVYCLTGMAQKLYAGFPRFVRILATLNILLVTGLFLSIACMGALALMVDGGITTLGSPRPDFWSIAKACSILGYTAAVVLIAYRLTKKKQNSP